MHASFKIEFPKYTTTKLGGRRMKLPSTHDLPRARIRVLYQLVVEVCSSSASRSICKWISGKLGGKKGRR